MTSLIVALPAPTLGAPTDPAASAPDFGYAVTADGHTPVVHATAEARHLPAPPRAGGETVAVVPARALSWHRVTLPPGSTAAPQRLRAVLDGLLEDRLLDEPQQLHFALAPGARAGSTTWVAACDRAWLRGLLQHLEAAGRPVTRIVPEFAPGVPEPSMDTESAPALRALHATGTADQPLWVAEQRDGSLLLLPMHPAALALVTAAGTDALAELAATAEPAVAQQAEHALGRPVPLVTPVQRWLAAARGDWDLAQFDLASSGGRRAAKRIGTQAASLWQGPQWRAARWGAAALVGVQLLGLNAWAWKERSALAEKDARVRATLTETFPSVRTIVDAPLQMAREVDALRQATGAASGRDLDAVLAQLAAAVPAGRALTTIDHRGGETQLVGLDLSTDEAAELTARLQALGLRATASGDRALRVRSESAP